MHALRRVSAFFGAAAPLGCAVLLCICKTDKICCNRFYTMVGATWLDMKYIEQFMYETFETPRYLRGQIEISYVPYTAEWQVSRKSMVRYNDVAAFTTYSTDRASAYRLLEDALNLRDIRIYDTIEDADGRERRVLNAKETTLAAQKQQLTKRTVIFVTPCFVCRLLLYITQENRAKANQLRQSTVFQCLSTRFRTSQPSSVTSTRSSTRTPNLPGKYTPGSIEKIMPGFARLWLAELTSPFS